MVVSFFGHSDFQATEEYTLRLLSILENEVGESPVDFYLGGYGNFDEFAYCCARTYKEGHPLASLLFITPYITLDYQNNHLKYEKQKYDSIVYPPIENKPLRFAITYRNRFIVDKSDLIICFVAHDWGGAYKAFKYAAKNGKQIVNLAKSPNI